MSDHADAGHGSHGEGDGAPLGGIDLAAWGAGAIGVAIGLLVLSNVNWRARLLARFFPRLFEKLLVPRMSGLKPGH